MTSPIDLNRMQIFKQVVAAGSFSKAATILRQPKSRVSRNIAALERELGVQLIYRTTRQFRLTDAGRELYDKSIAPLEALSEILESVSSVSDVLSGTLRVTAPEDIGVTLLADVCRAFVEIHPKVHIDLQLTADVLNLVKDSIDIAIRIGRLKDSSLIQKKIGHARMALFISPTLRKKRGVMTRIEDVERLPFLAFSNIQQGRTKIELNNGKSRRTLHTNNIFTSNNFLVLRSLATHAMGLARLPVYLVQDELRRGTLVQVFSDWSSDDVPIQVIIPQQREPSARVRRFMDFVATQMAPYFT